MTNSTLPTISTARGMRDLLPEEMRAFRRVEDAFRAAAQRWGYQEVRTPIVESYSLFTAAGALTPQMLSRVYSFLDWDGWSGERIVLRPDSTIPVARAAANAGLGLPARLFYVQSVMRFSNDEREGEDWQYGVEYLDAPAAIGDLEVVAVACETLEALGIEPEVRLAHVGLARAVVDELEPLDEAETRDLMERVRAEGLAALRPAAAGHPGAAAFLAAALEPSGSITLLGNLAALARAGLPGAIKPLAELRDEAKALNDAGRPVHIDLGMARDFEYYTGVVFDVVSGGDNWGSGGRYSPNVPGASASACGLGLEATRLIEHVRATTRRQTVVSVIPGSEAFFSESMNVARALHRNGINAALATAESEFTIAVVVSEDGLTAHTPDGEKDMSSLDDVVGLLLQYK
jgi:histidyl-tRNA synthetase